MSTRIFLSAPDVRQYERQYVMAAIDSNWIAPAGPDLSAFEDELATATGRKYAVGLTSGTAAIHLALLHLGVKPGDTVLCSSLTFAGSANPIIYCGATPVFIDSEITGWNIDPQLLRDELAERAKAGSLPAAAVVVDLYGNCARYDEIIPILAEYDVPLVEDAAEALGATYMGRPAGSYGEHGILSFNGNKIITSSGGGAFVSDSAEAADRVRYLSTQARQPLAYYEHTEIGFNYRLSNICAALGRAQLLTLPERIARRREINARYRQLFADVDGVSLLEPVPEAASNYWLTCAVVDSATCSLTRDQIIATLEVADIESRPVWKPMHLQPVFADAPRRENGTSERLFEQGICLPSGSGMAQADLERVLRCIETALG